MPVCHLCEAEIIFDPTKVSPRTGVIIPQSLNGGEHNKYYPCKKGCGGEVYFDKKMKSANGVPILISKARIFTSM